MQKNKETTVNGKPITDVSALHKLWGEFLSLNERFESRSPIISTAKAQKLEQLADDLTAGMPAVWEKRNANRWLAGMQLNRLVRLEEELGRIREDASEDYSLRSSGWIPDENRIEGESEDLEESLAETEREINTIWFQIHRVRKSTENKVALSKLGLTEYFSWATAWANARTAMKTLGEDLRAAQGWARTVRRELDRREYDRVNERDDSWTLYETSGFAGATECESDFDLPALGPNVDWAEWELMAAPSKARR